MELLGYHTGHEGKEGDSMSYAKIRPDYTIDTARVFQNFVTRLMQGSVGIRAMTLIQGGWGVVDLKRDHELQRHAAPTWKGEGQLPSWVPNLAHRDTLPLSSGAIPLVDDMDQPARRALRPAYNVFNNSYYTSAQRFHIRGTDLHVFGRRIGTVEARAKAVPYAAETAPCLEFAVNVFNALVKATPAYMDTATGTQEPLLASLMKTMGLGVWVAATDEVTPDTRAMAFRYYDVEMFFSQGLAGYSCFVLQDRMKDDGASSVDSLLEDIDEISHFPRIPGLSNHFLRRQLFRLRKPEQIFNLKGHTEGLVGCLVDAGEYEKFYTMCDHLTREFPHAKGRSILSIALDSPFAHRFRTEETTPEGGGDGSEANTYVLGLGPGRVSSGDEVWALQGSEWPFVMGRRHQEDGRPETRRKFRDSARRWWPSWENEGDDAEVGVYELRGEVYVHGLMNGAVDEDLSRNLEEIIIS